MKLETTLIEIANRLVAREILARDIIAGDNHVAVERHECEAAAIRRQRVVPVRHAVVLVRAAAVRRHDKRSRRAVECHIHARDPVAVGPAAGLRAEKWKARVRGGRRKPE